MNEDERLSSAMDLVVDPSPVFALKEWHSVLWLRKLVERITSHVHTAELIHCDAGVFAGLRLCPEAEVPRLGAIDPGWQIIIRGLKYFVSQCIFCRH